MAGLHPAARLVLWQHRQPRDALYLTPAWVAHAAAAIELFWPCYFRGGAIGLMAVTAMADQEYAHDFLTLSRKVGLAEQCVVNAKLHGRHRDGRPEVRPRLLPAGLQGTSRTVVA